MTTQSFPPPPPATLTRDDVVAYLVELRARGWEIYKEAPDVFIVQTSATEQQRINFRADLGTCHFTWSSKASGHSALGPTVGNMLDFDNYMRERTGGDPPLTSVHLRLGEPATNHVRLARLIRGAKVEAVYDPYLDDKGLATLLTLVQLDGGVAPVIRVLTSDRKTVNPDFVTALFVELGCDQAKSEIRSVPDRGHQGRFILLAGGRAITLGMSLNGLNVNDDAYLGDDREHRPLFESEWAKAGPVKTIFTSVPTPARPPGSAAPSP
jgi:hypothetical protein